MSAKRFKREYSQVETDRGEILQSIPKMPRKTLEAIVESLAKKGEAEVLDVLEGAHKEVCEGIHSLSGKDEMFHLIFSFLPEEELLKKVPSVNALFREANHSDPRWLPVIAPPDLCGEVLDLPRHGRMLRNLYRVFLDWQKSWDQLASCIDADGYYDNYEELLSRQSVLDGFFSLAPWQKNRANVSFSYPMPWLHQMVYGRPCPTESIGNNGLPAPDPGKEIPVFFMERERRRGRRTDRDRLTEPVGHTIPPGFTDRFQRVVIQPLNIRNADGTRNDALLDFNEETLYQLNEASRKILECYVGRERVFVKPLVDHGANLILEEEREEDVRDGAPFMAVLFKLATWDKKSVAMHYTNAFRRGVELFGKDFGCGDTDVIVYMTASPICSDDHRNSDSGLSVNVPQGNILSTFFLGGGSRLCTKQICRFAHQVLQSTLAGFDLVEDYCGNKACALNCDDETKQEREEGSYLVCCPACLRKLHLGGVIGDVPAFLERLSQVLKEEPFVSGSQKDLRILNDLGYGV